MSILSALSAITAIAGAAPVTSFASVPPREPIFIVNDARRATWARMRATGHWLYQLASSNCVQTGTRNARYGDTGLWCAWIYQVSNDRLAARRAVGVLRAMGRTPSNANQLREHFTERVILTDWLWDAMTEVERAEVLANLDGWARFATGNTGKRYLGGIRTHDSDQTIGTYFGLATFDRLNRSLGRPGHWLDSTSAPIGGQKVPIGGLDVTGPGPSTARNALEFYSKRAAGGEWHESASYNPGTLAFIVMGVEAMRTALGRDAFQTTSNMLQESAHRESFAVTPDQLQAVQWGDEEHPRAFVGRLFKRTTLLGMLQGVTGNAAVHRTLLDIWRKHGTTGYQSGEPNARILLLYDPFGVVAESISTGSHVASGRGHLYVRSDRELFFAEASKPSAEDHDVKYMSNAALYRDGAWMLDHPLGYGGAANGPYATNSVSYAGFGAMAARGMTRTDSGDGWWSITGTTSGPLYTNYYDPPPTFLDLGTRTTWFLHEDDWSVIVARDSVAMRDPRTLPKFERYRPAHKQPIIDADGAWETIWHMPVSPTPDRSGFTWPTSNGEHVHLLAFGTDVRSTVVDERKLWAGRTGGTGVNPSTMAFQVRMRPKGDVLWTVVLAGRGTPPAVSRTASGVAVGGREITLVRGRPSVR